MKLRRRQVLTGLLMMCLVLTGCSKGGGKSAIGLSSTTVTGKVTEVDGKNVTLTLGVVQSRGAFSGMFGGSFDGTVPDMPSGEAPSGKTPSGEAPNSEAPNSEAPNGKAPNGNMPNMPDGIGQGRQSFVSGETTAEFTVSDESVIYIEMNGDSNDTSSNQDSSTETTTTQGSLKDITKDAVLSIELDKDGAITKITVLNIQAGLGGMNWPGASDSNGV